jgi:hypothetical protein
MASIKTLLNMTPEQLEAMSDADLKAYCEPFLRVVVVKAAEVDEDDEPKTPKTKKPKGDTWKVEAAKLMKELGLKEPIDLPRNLK